MSNSVDVRFEDSICIITLDRAQSRNALSSAMAEELRGAVERAAETARAVILTGSGPAFCAGADLKERAGMNGIESRVHNRRLFTAIQAVATCPIPVVAAVNGAAMGGGCELALAADIRVADPSAQFALPEIALGIIPGAGGTQRIFHAVTEGWARAMLFTGKRIDAELALRIGLVQEVSPAEGSLDSARMWARAIARNAPLAVRAVKEMIVAREQVLLTHGLTLERETLFRLFLTEDRDEGLRAFSEHREPQYQGR